MVIVISKSNNKDHKSPFDFDFELDKLQKFQKRFS